MIVCKALMKIPDNKRTEEDEDEEENEENEEKKKKRSTSDEFIYSLYIEQ